MRRTAATVLALAVTLALSGCTGGADPASDVERAVARLAHDAGPDGDLRRVEAELTLAFGEFGMHAVETIDLYRGDAFRVTLEGLSMTTEDGTQEVDGTLWVQCTPDTLAVESSGFEDAGQEAVSVREDNPLGTCLGLDGEQDAKALAAALEDSVDDASLSTLLSQAVGSLRVPEVEIVEAHREDGSSVAEVNVTQDGQTFSGTITARDGHLRSFEMSLGDVEGFSFEVTLDYEYGPRSAAPAT